MSKIIEIASNEIGYQEGANKSNKYGQWFGLNNVSWCGIFISWCYAQAGYSLGRIDFMKGFASVPFALNYFRNTQQITINPQAGDIVILDWKCKGGAEHVELFERDLDDGHIVTIGGNTSSVNASNGGCVERKIREKKFITAYVHPKVLDAFEDTTKERLA